jgi:hypothetical protein
MGVVFGCVVAAIRMVSDLSWDELLQHSDRLRSLAASSAFLGVIAVYYGAFGVGVLSSGDGGWLVNLVAIPLAIATLIAIPIWICGPQTRMFYRPDTTSAAG